MHIISNRELGEVFEQKDAIIIKESQNRYQFFRIVYHAMHQVGLGWIWSTPGGCSLAFCTSHMTRVCLTSTLYRTDLPTYLPQAPASDPCY